MYGSGEEEAHNRARDGWARWGQPDMHGREDPGKEFDPVWGLGRKHSLNVFIAETEGLLAFWLDLLARLRWSPLPFPRCIW